MKTKAYSYLRVSGKGQLEGDGFDRQRDTIAKYARAHRIELVREFREEGVSGENEMADRPALTDLIAEIMGNGVRLILVENSTRLARDTIVQELIIQQCQKLGVRIVAADAGVDLTEGDKNNPTQKLIRTILGAVSEWEKCNLVLKLRAARMRGRKAGKRVEGQKPFGEHPERPEEAATLARLLELHRKPVSAPRRSLEEIARILNQEQRPTRTGRPWTRGTVYAIVRRLKG